MLDRPFVGWGGCAPLDGGTTVLLLRGLARAGLSGGAGLPVSRTSGRTLALSALGQHVI